MLQCSAPASRLPAACCFPTKSVPACMRIIAESLGAAREVKKAFFERRRNWQARAILDRAPPAPGPIRLQFFAAFVEHAKCGRCILVERVSYGLHLQIQRPALQRPAIDGKAVLVFSRPGAGCLVQRIVLPGVVLLEREDVEELIKNVDQRRARSEPPDADQRLFAANIGMPHARA